MIMIVIEMGDQCELQAVCNTIDDRRKGSLFTYSHIIIRICYVLMQLLLNDE